MPLVALEPGSTFAGDYRVVRRLSEGGMGAVYVVSQISTGKNRALKLMHPQLVVDEALRRRFEQEAQVGSKIESEHVVEVQLAGVDPTTQTPYLVMELLAGRDLATQIEMNGPMGVAEMMTIFEQLCHALGAAHTAGIVHRDLKPENIFLAEAKRAQTTRVVKVLDFGIAKITADAEAKSKSTAPMGSPMWMAPEQTERGAITPAADVWALGMLAFYVLTGKSYWTTGNEEDSAVAQIMREVLFSSMPAATRRANDYGASVPPWFDAWFESCTNRSPTLRFQSATDLWVALAGATRAGSGTMAMSPLSGDATAERHTTADVHGEIDKTEPARRRGLATVAAVGVAAVAVVVVSTLVWRHGNAVEQPVTSVSSSARVPSPPARELVAAEALSELSSASAISIPDSAAPPAAPTAESDYNTIDGELRARFDYETGHHRYATLAPEDIMGKLDQQTGKFISEGKYRDDAKVADAYDRRLAHISETYDSQLYQAAAFARRGSLYDSLRSGLADCAGPGFHLFSAKQEATLKQMRASGKDDLIALANDIDTKVQNGWRAKRDQEIDGADAIMIRYYTQALNLADTKHLSHPAITRARARIATLTPLIGDAKMRTYAARVP